MGKYVIAGIAVVIIVVGGGYWLTHRAAPAAPQTADTQQVPIAVATSTYSTTTFSVVYPQDFTPDPSYTYTQFQGKPIAGVKFTIPTSMATGTNLIGDTYVSVEELPHAHNCTGDIFVVPNVPATTETDNGITYSVATTSGAGAGNLYEEQVYAIASSSPCIAVRYFIHSTHVENFPPGTVTAYDRQALLAAFDAIRRSVTLMQ